ncbi:MAG: hypothetical protein HUU47_06990 [Bacteroidetes bacterium]|nr:hypothetical protein [Bacteroidota bacterium]
MKNFKLILFTFLINIGCLHVFSQPAVKFEWSEYSRVKKYSQNIFLSKTNSDYVSIIKNGSKYTIIKYDSSLKITKEHNFNLSKNRERIIGIWIWNYKIYFLTQYELKNQKVAVKSRVFEINDLRIFKSDFLMILDKNRFSRNIAYRLLEGDSTIEIYHTKVYESNDENFSLIYTTFSKDLKLLDKAVFEIPVKYTLCEVLKAEKHDNNIFLFTKQYNVRPIERRGLSSNYYFGFYVANPSNETLEKYLLKYENLYLDGGRAKYKNGKNEAAGFFSDTYKGGKVGFWYLNYDFTNFKKIKDTLVYFDKKTKELPSNGFHKSVFKQYNFESFIVDYLVKANNEKNILIAEQFMLIPASFGSAYTYNRFYGDILILYFDKNLNIYNSQRIVKLQQTFNNTGEFSSYYIERYDSILYFFYNDNINSIFKKTPHQLVWHKHSCLALVKASESKNESFILADYAAIGGIIQVRDIVEIGQNQYLVYARMKNKTKIGIMKLIE